MPQVDEVGTGEVVESWPSSILPSHTVSQTLHGTAIYAYIGAVLGVNVGIYGIHEVMECLGYGCVF